MNIYNKNFKNNIYIDEYKNIYYYFTITSLFSVTKFYKFEKIKKKKIKKTKEKK